MPFLLRITPFDHLLRPGVFKTQQISHTDRHTIQTEGEAYISVRVYLLITAFTFATSTGTPSVTIRQ